MNLKIEQIRSISPSKYLQFKQCQLSELWSLSGNKRIVPSNADAVLGTIIHNVFERFSDDRTLTIAQFEIIWGEIEANVLGKQVFNNQPDSDRYKPLKITSNYYSPKKFNTKSAIEKILNGRQNDQSGDGITELGLSSTSKKIYGKIDLLIKNNQTNEITLIDYKTGSIHDEQGDIKMEYVLQLKIYALLYNQNYQTIFGGTKQWPDYLKLIDNEGNPHTIEYTPQEIENIIVEIETKIEETNKIIQENIVNLEDHFSVVGLHCKYCNFRPACTKYIASPELNKDMVGVIKSIRLIAKSNKWVVSFEENKNSLHYFLLTDDDRKIEVADLVGKKCIFTNIIQKTNQAYNISSRFSIFKILDIKSNL